MNLETTHLKTVIAGLTLLCFGLRTPTLPAADNSQATTPPKQGAALLKVDLLGVFAHPDDETGVASTVATYARSRNKTVAHVYITRGEGGGNMVGTQSGAALGMLREAELRDCLTLLGVRYCYFLDQLDWAYTESLAATLRKWGKEETLGRLVRAIRTLRPDVILTMNPAPTPGQHGHHQAAGVLAIEAFTAAASASRFPEQLHDEGLAPWQTRKLYIGGGGTNATAVIQPGDTLPDGRTIAQVAAEALSQHRSQAFGNFSSATWLSRPQSFTLVKSALRISSPETDLLQWPPPGPTLPAGSAFVVTDLERARAELERQAAEAEKFTFVPRPAIARYQAWIKDQGILHLAGRFRADVPLVAGEPNTVVIQIAGMQRHAATGHLRVTGPEGWTVDPPVVSIAPATLANPSRISVRITPPTGRPADGELNATMDIGTIKLLAAAVAHPIPHARVPRLRRPPQLDGTDTGWETVAAHRIAPTDVAQGKSVSDADSSASFRLAHDGRRLYVDVQVSDDRIVSNIAPDDIKGHWRSDSVEICLDPAGGAEDTMGCYKIGIFPFDTKGVVRAARDADAKQGPVEETAPGTKLSSVRTPAGYRIQASIPFAEIGFKPKRGQRLGFNVIVYDGDKADAAPGENINKSRLAWSPRPGVQGRPEDWGRLDLE